MCKKLLSLLLCFCLVLSLSLPVLAQEGQEPALRTLRIHTPKQLLALGESCRLDSYSQGLQVLLEEDLDMTGIPFEPIPIFCGSFLGQGHTISGLTLTGEGSYQGLFRRLTETAQVWDLNLEGQLAPGGSQSWVGGIAGENRGLIQNCSFRGSVSGSSRVGGLVGENGLTGTIRNCRVQGTVQGSHFTGGIAGENKGLLRATLNHAQVNATSQQNTVSLTDITIDSILSSESAATVTDIGGIAGASTGVIRKCVNHGSVGYRHMGYNIGGIAGTQSGLVDSCTNFGQVQGRKEVGGIVGQLEPAALVNFQKDALQIIRGQLDSMVSTVNKTAANVEDTGEALFGQIAALGDHAENAGDALELLLPKVEEDELIPPDEEALETARTNLSSSLGGMTEVLSGMNATTWNAVGRLSNNLHTLQQQMNAMTATLDNASETLGGSLRDMSDLDTGEDITGKVVSCRNLGSVLGDRNVGGISGAMALENDLDPEEDWKLQGSSSLNFESQLRAVILECENQGAVTAGKRAAGGIAGWQSLGLIRQSVNTGSLDGAEYVGGIAGQSLGFIRSCSAKGALTGSRYVGGIAGSAAVVTDCLAMPLLRCDGECRGAILGGTEDDRSETQSPTGNNCYLTVDQDYGGIDGVSYEGIAQELGEKAFMEQPQLPDAFRKATVTFLFADGQETRFTLPAGSGMEELPELPVLTGSQSAWEGLEAQELRHIYFDTTLREVRKSYAAVLESQARTQAGQPLLLVQGEFPEEAALTLEETALTPPIREGDRVLGTWLVKLTHPQQGHTLHLRLPEGGDPGRITLQVHTGEGWQTQSFTPDGSYLVFPMPQGLDAVALQETPPYPWQYPAMIVGGAALVMGLAVLVRKGRKRK